MTLLDKFRYTPKAHFKAFLPSHEKRLTRAAIEARRFVFDEEASTLLGHFVATCPDLIVKNYEFAIPPFPQCYVEFNIDAMLNELKRFGAFTTADNRSDWAQRDINIGYLFVDTVIYPIVESERMLASVYPIVYSTKPVAGTDLDRRSRRMTATHYLGSTMDRVNSEDAFKVADHYWTGLVYEGIEADSQLFQNCVGDIRNVISMLLLLNQQKHVSLTYHKPERRLTKGKLRTYSAFSKVTIHLAGEKEIRRAFNVLNRASPRAHEVRGHFCHRRVIRGCDHDWERPDPTIRQWFCRYCGGLRYWRKACQRGNSGSGGGFVFQEWSVTK